MSKEKRTVRALIEELKRDRGRPKKKRNLAGEIVDNEDNK